MNKIKPDSTGRYRIVTQGSEHVWDLDAETWTRTHKDGLNPMSDRDGVTLQIVDVVRWPKVGGVFFVWATKSPTHPMLQWHQSSTIVSITKEKK